LEAPEEMPLEERRNFGIVRLRHRATGKSLMLVATHMMTDSRDCAATNKFPGEVRAHELATIRDVVQAEQREQRSDAVIFTGDFNISLVDNESENELRVLLGRIPSVPSQENMPALEIPTGFVMEGGRAALQWQGAAMQEAFEDVHRWGAGVGPGRVCSSYSNKRCNWIDFMFYTADSLELKAHSENRTPPTPIPAERFPSDHLPISASFEFRRQ